MGVPAIKVFSFGGAFVMALFSVIVVWMLDDFRVVWWLLVADSAWTGVFLVHYLHKAVVYYRRKGEKR